MSSNKLFNHYELQALRQLKRWEKKMMTPPGKANQLGKRIQNRINSLIPLKIHNGITTVMRKMVEAVLFTSEYVIPPQTEHTSLEEREQRIENRMEYYRTTASAEGGVTGMTGIWGSLADFPILLSIKLKFLFDVATIYGFDTSKTRERIFLLHVFQLAFSSPARQADTYSHLAFWSVFPQTIPANADEMNWYQFQQDYRDYLDIAKLLQMIPVVGGGVGVVVNYRLLNRLHETAKNCYRMRCLYAT